LFYQLDIIIDMLANDHEQDHLASNSNDADAQHCGAR
jgi:hypothetical protein